MLRLILSAGCVLAIAAWPALTAQAFSSLTVGEALQDMLLRGRTRDPGHDHGYRHRQITSEALTPFGFSVDALQHLFWHNFLTDWDQYAHTIARPPTERYRPADHCDRNEGERSAESFTRALAALSLKRRQAVRQLKRGQITEGLATLGHAQHGIQDAYSHTNVVDLGPEDRAEVLALQTGHLAVPGTRLLSRLRVTGTSRRALTDLAGSEDPEPGYGHDAFSKDDARKNAEARSPAALAPGHTKYQLAYALAVEATRAYTARVRDEAGKEAWNRALAYRR